MSSAVGKSRVGSRILGSNFGNGFTDVFARRRVDHLPVERSRVQGDLGHRLSWRRTEASHLGARRPSAAVESGRARAALCEQRDMLIAAAVGPDFESVQCTAVSCGSFSGE